MSALIQIPPKPAPLRLEAPAESYADLAKSIGFMPGVGGLLGHEIRCFLASKNIPVYNNAEVFAYMDAIAFRAEKDWSWKPLRECDHGVRIRPRHVPRPHKETWLDKLCGYARDWHDLGGVDDDTYIHPVPAEHLRNVRTIQDKYGEGVKFLVTDYASPKPDPFICVVGNGTGPIVFGVWDEPGFGS